MICNYLRLPAVLLLTLFVPQNLHAIESCTPGKIFVQAGPGSFNDQALSLLRKAKTNISCKDIIFAGTPTEAMKQATEDGTHAGLVFTAVHNNLIGPVKPTAEALESYRVLRTLSGIDMPIEMCVIVPKSASTTTAIKHVASIKPALDQVQEWILAHKVITIEEPKGTSEAAKKLSQNQYSRGTAVIAPKAVTTIYPNLKASQCGIEDKASHTEFALIEVRKRHSPISDKKSQHELSELIQTLRRLHTQLGT